MKKLLSVVAAVGLVAAALGQGVTAQAKAPTTVPTKGQIEDPVGDANFLNDQDVIGTPLDGQGDNVTLADVGSVSDFIRGWFSNTKKTISLHLLTEAPPPATSTVYFRVAANPGEGELGENVRGCLNWRMIFGGQYTVQGNTLDLSTYRDSDVTKGASLAEFEDTCNVEGAQRENIEVTVETLEDGSGVTTMTVPRSFSPLFAKGGKVLSPYAISRVAVGQKGTELPTGGDFHTGYATTDTTKKGTEYVIKDKKRRRT